MAVFNVVINVVLVAATLAVIWFASLAVRESRKATSAAEKTVTKAGEIVDAVRDLLAAAERDRRLRQLRAIGGLVEDIFWQAMTQGPVWAGRCKEQNELAHALVGVEPPLPKCSAVVGAGEAGPVSAAAREAREEAAAAINETRAAGNATPPPV
jgi:hypothetical protein